MGTDLTSLIKSGNKKFLILPVIGSAVITLLLLVLGQKLWALGLLRGFVLGIVDAVIMITGIRKSLPYVNEPEKGLRVMKRYRWYRLIAVSSIILLLLKQGADVLGVFIGLLLIHIFLIFNLIFIAYRLNKKET